MAIPMYNKKVTALLVIDPYNDFISEGGKAWNRLKGVAEANHCVPHMMQVLDAARKAELRVFYALHDRCRPGDYETWKYIEILGEQLERVASNPNVVTGHWVLEENPKETTDALINFL